MISLSTIMSYICLVFIWDIIAGIIKPGAYIATTSMAISGMLILFGLRNSFQETRRKSRVLLESSFQKSWKARISSIFKKISQYISQRQNTSPTAGAQRSTKSSLPSNDESILSHSKARLDKLAEESERFKNFVNFLYAWVSKNPMLRTGFEKMMMSPPFSINRYVTQLLANILFVSKSKSCLTQTTMARRWV